ncbi:helix-turn-helix domain-containing protein [Streptomyces sp. HP-A2021]|uniref:helix-turn-helix domain-containing protein n=1 Tax=Streptomyces sp. HP-A2021 TaxID=2927875 RepID=UPI001FAEFD66|nr:helix-turn-helix domain-containing protein [Streptomyces sp. HP-A2021]UOB09128.1 helix-turn-helix domain-containing protein [Streptomyces sp. HP-A2021]
MTGRPITGSTRIRTRQRAAQLYMEGCTITSVARQIGYSYGTARTLILEAGVRIRRRGGAR